ncbi:O-antigen ligase [Halococcus sp. IIIV-5B]|uniref:O-antigen ligase family protein n=1 Tax=Halococcus sp. IIIV-5B TaxID=2321230 RepID=UPI000E75AF06|nr:O-antigen ligase family protein [Halococcus sp. IIIV-5B]RJT00194.1 O-antigen ligase family protein [Halococcus sp. IIIV-5B]
MKHDAVLDFLLLVCLLSSVLLAATPISSGTGYMLATGVYIIVLAISFARGTLAVRFDRAILLPIVALWVVFLVEYWFHPGGRATFRTGAYIVFSALNLFVIPATFSREGFVDALAAIAAVVAGIALPLVWFGVTYQGELLGLWHGSTQMNSILTNPNYLSALSAFGFVACFGVARSRRRRWLAVIGGICCLVGFGVSQGRAAILGTVAAIVILAVYRTYGTRAVAGVVAIGIAGAVVGFRLTLGPIAGIDVTQNIGNQLNNRGELWNAAVRAILDRPILGYGLVDDGPILAAYGAPTPGDNVFSAHNSYLRMFLMTGVVGGVLYLLVCLAALRQALRTMARSTSTDSLSVFLPLLCVVLILELFSNSPIFGVSFVSVFGALVVGYSQGERRIPLRAERIWMVMVKAGRNEQDGT